MTPQSAPLGYAVLTRQADGSWKDDWDGEVHATLDRGLAELTWASSSLGPDSCKLVALHPVEVVG